MIVPELPVNDGEVAVAVNTFGPATENNVAVNVVVAAPLVNDTDVAGYDGGVLDGAGLVADPDHAIVCDPV